MYYRLTIDLNGQLANRVLVAGNLPLPGDLVVFSVRGVYGLHVGKVVAITERPNSLKMEGVNVHEAVASKNVTSVYTCEYGIGIHYKAPPCSIRTLLVQKDARHVCTVYTSLTDYEIEARLRENFTRDFIARAEKATHG